MTNANLILKNQVSVTDIDRKKLTRMKIKFFHQDMENGIILKLIDYKKVFKTGEFDLIIIGTPPKHT